MLKLFRRIRRKLIADGRIGQYLAYALGEIILVVIGILIALSINNWNERKQDRQRLHNVFAMLIEDIADDTLDVRQVLDFHDSRKDLFLKVMNDSLSREDKMACRACDLATLYRQLSIERRGFEALLALQEEFGEDSLITRTAHLYNYSLKYISGQEENIAAAIKHTMTYWRDRYDWYPQFVQGTPTYAAGEYFATSPEYKNIVAQHYVEVYLVHVPVLVDFQEDMKRLARDLQARLDES